MPAAFISLRHFDELFRELLHEKFNDSGRNTLHTGETRFIVRLSFFDRTDHRRSYLQRVRTIIMAVVFYRVIDCINFPGYRELDTWIELIISTKVSCDL